MLRKYIVLKSDLKLSNDQNKAVNSSNTVVLMVMVYAGRSFFPCGCWPAGYLCGPPSPSTYPAPCTNLHFPLVHFTLLCLHGSTPCTGVHHTPVLAAGRACASGSCQQRSPCWISHTMVAPPSAPRLSTPTSTWLESFQVLPGLLHDPRTGLATVAARTAPPVGPIRGASWNPVKTARPQQGGQRLKGP